MKSISHYCLLALTVIVFASCQRELDLPGSINRPTVFDSTLLVKSIELIYHDRNGQPGDSTTENYTYDTTNRKITVSWESSMPDINGSSAVHSYDADSLLTSITFNHVAPFPEDYTSITFSYDNEKVINTVVLNYVSSPTETKRYKKTVLAGGYRLDWGNSYYDPINQQTYKDTQTAFFNAAGKCIKYQITAGEVDGSGNITIFQEFKDSLVYSLTGDLYRVYRQLPQPNNIQYLAYEFEGRHNKGNQLSGQRDLLFRGMENMRFDEADGWFWTSILTDSPDAYECDQYTSFPFTTVKAYNMTTNGIVPFTSEASFDILDRLLSFKGYFNDETMKPMLYKITYYK